MPGVVHGKRRAPRVVIGLVPLVLVGCGIGLWVAWPRLFPDPWTQALRAYDRSDWPGAERSAREILKTRGDDPDALRLLARASVRMGRDDRALAIYSRRLGVASIQAEDELLWGLALRRRGEGDQALRHWDKALEAEPVPPETLEGLIHLFCEAGGPFEAPDSLGPHPIDQAARAAERLRRYPGWESRADLMLGSIRIAIRDIPGAVETFRRVLRLDPGEIGHSRDPAQLRKQIARTFLRAGRPAEARAAMRPAPSLGADPEASWLLSRACLQEGDAAGARQEMALAGSYRRDHPLEEEPGPYVGEARCQRCHPTLCRDSLGSRHTRTFYRGAQLRSLPLPGRPLADPTDPAVTHTIREVDGALRAETRVADTVLRSVIEYAFGTSDRYLTMVGRDASDHYRILRLSYYRTPTGDGWDRTVLNAGEPARDEDFGGRPVSVCGNVVKCLYCHVTFARGGSERTGPETADRAIGCERCHGPGAHHLASVAAGLPDPAIVNPAAASPRAVSEAQCNDCHILDRNFRRRDDRENPYWVRSQGAGWSWSRCNTESDGAFGCVTCHDPHRGAGATTTAQYEARCLGCHSPPAAGRPDDPGTPGRPGSRPDPRACPVDPKSGCIRCHMPVVRTDASHLDLTDHYIRIRRP